MTRVQTDPRIRRRRNDVARGRKRKLLTVVITLAVLALATWGAFWSPLLSVRDVKLTGATHTTAAEVAAAAGLGPDDNLLLLSAGEVVEAARSLPWVADAEVERRLPGTVKVKVVERKPALVLSLGVAARWTIDAHGHVLAAGQTEPGLPVIGDVEVGDIKPGKRLSGAVIDEVLATWRSLPKKLASDVQAIFAPSLERISFTLVDGTQVRYGAAERLDAKNEVLLALRKRLAEEGRLALYVDVRVPTSPAVGPPPPELPETTPNFAAQ
ncbi:MAG TPA: FtsQ-type POTRA domain-containing protein [Actinomycetota bacterium]|nr:FtsQ-type POTRA domain-containing protein [Actinomycetota bacterium]